MPCIGSSALRRIDFAEEVRRNSRDIGLRMANTMDFAFRRRYQLPPTDPRYLAATDEEIVADYWANVFFDDPKRAEEEVVNDDFDSDLEDMAAEVEALGAPPEAAQLPPPHTGGEDEWEPVAKDEWSGS